MFVRHGSQFISEFFGYHVVSRALTLLEGSRVEQFYYTKAIIRGSFPWALLLPFAIVFAIREMKKQPRYAVVLLMPAATLVLYMLVRTKLYWYLLPIYPAFAILIAALIDGGCRSYPQFRRAILSVFAFGLWFVIYVSLQNANILAAEQHLRWTPLYEESESSLATLARSAAASAPNDRQPLLLCSDDLVLPAHLALFYSGRPVQQAFAFRKPITSPPLRYFDPKPLSSLMDSTPRQAIISRELLPRLAPEYEVLPLRRAGRFVHAVIKRKVDSQLDLQIDDGPVAARELASHAN
jgi:hypothetical protein